MAQDHHRLATHWWRREDLDWQVDKERLHHNLENLKKMAKRVYALLHEFHRLTETAQGNIEVASALQRDINIAAERLGLAPIPFEQIKSSRQRTDGE